MTNKLTVLFKTMVLYMIDRVDFELTANQIGEFMVSEDYMSYFSFQQLLFEMERDGLVRAKKANHNTFYRLEEAGEEALRFFGSNLQDDIRGEIDEYLRLKRWELRDASSVRTDYTLSADGDYSVRLQILENQLPMIDLTVSVPDEEIARKVCKRWEENNDHIYAYIMHNLL